MYEYTAIDFTGRERWMRYSSERDGECFFDLNDLPPGPTLRLNCVVAELFAVVGYETTLLQPAAKAALRREAAITLIPDTSDTRENKSNPFTACVITIGQAFHRLLENKDQRAREEEAIIGIKKHLEVIYSQAPGLPAEKCAATKAAVLDGELNGLLDRSPISDRAWKHMLLSRFPNTKSATENFIVSATDLVTRVMAAGSARRFDVEYETLHGLDDRYPFMKRFVENAFLAGHKVTASEMLSL